MLLQWGHSLIFQMVLLLRGVEASHSNHKTPLAHFSWRRALIRQSPPLTLQQHLCARQFPDTHRSHLWFYPPFSWTDSHFGGAAFVLWSDSAFLCPLKAWYTGDGPGLAGTCYFQFSPCHHSCQTLMTQLNSWHHCQAFLNVPTCHVFQGVL